MGNPSLAEAGADQELARLLLALEQGEGAYGEREDLELTDDPYHLARLNEQCGMDLSWALDPNSSSTRGGTNGIEAIKGGLRRYFDACSTGVERFGKVAERVLAADLEPSLVDSLMDGLVKTVIRGGSGALGGAVGGPLGGIIGSVIGTVLEGSYSTLRDSYRSPGGGALTELDQFVGEISMGLIEAREKAMVDVQFCLSEILERLHHAQWIGKDLENEITNAVDKLDPAAQVASNLASRLYEQRQTTEREGILGGLSERPRLELTIGIIPYPFRITVLQTQIPGMHSAKVNRLPRLRPNTASPLEELMMGGRVGSVDLDRKVRVSNTDLEWHTLSGRVSTFRASAHARQWLADHYFDRMSYPAHLMTAPQAESAVQAMDDLLSQAQFRQPRNP